MPREHPDYRDSLELLNSIFPGKAMISRAEAAKAIGSTIRTVDRHLPKVNGNVSKVALAKYMCGG